MADAGLTPGELDVLRKLAEALDPQQLAKFTAVADHGELLLSEAQRAHQRRTRRSIAGAEVTRNAWTPEQAKLNGLMNSLRSMMRRYDNVKAAFEPLYREMAMAEADLQMMQDKVRAFHEDMGREGRTVALDRDSSVVDITELAPDGS